MASITEIQELADNIARQFSPEKIILFGSRARGDATPNFDVDLLVVMAHAEHASRKAAEITSRVHPRRFALDLIVRSPETLRQRLQMMTGSCAI